MICLLKSTRIRTGSRILNASVHVSTVMTGSTHPSMVLHVIERIRDYPALLVFLLR